MNNYKNLLYCLMLVNAALAVTVEHPTTVENAPKINWKPVCDEPEVFRDAEVRHHTADHLGNDMIEDFGAEQQIPVYVVEKPIQLLRDTGVDTCAAPSGRGLKNLLKEAKSILPLEQIKKIVSSALANDQQVQALKMLLASAEFRSKISTIKQSRDYSIVRDFACKVLNLDLKYYAEFLRSLLNLSEESSASVASPDHKGRPGIRGLLLDICDVLPKQQLKELYQRLTKTDESLVSAVGHLKSSEFRQLLGNLHNMAEFKELREMLLKVGVPLDEQKKLVDTALGWQADEIVERMNMVEMF